jgi:exonuclease III
MRSVFNHQTLSAAFIAGSFLMASCGATAKKSNNDTPGNGQGNGPIVTAPSDVDTTPRMNLKVLSYNTYLLPADNLAQATSDQRLYYLPDALARTDADIIILQEVWTERSQQSLKTAMKAKGYEGYILDSKSLVLPFFLGSGLMIFAKNNFRPAGQPEFQAWRENAGFDRAAKKGALRVPFQINGIGRVEIYNAHTSFLPWDADNHDYNYTEKDILLSQIQQLSDWARQSNANIKILGADLNTAPFVWDRAMGGFDSSRANGFYDRIRQVFDDPFAHVKPECPFTCDTWDNQNNELIANGLFGSRDGSLYDPEPNAKYDYVMFSGPGTKVIKTGTAMHETFTLTYNGKQIRAPLSDHFGIITELAIPLQSPL